jgi:hypothetical protein
MSRYLWNLLLLLDQSVNTVFGPVLNLVLRPVATARFGDPTERLSSVFGKNVDDGSCSGCKFMCKILNWIQPGHCQSSIQPYAGSDADS